MKSAILRGTLAAQYIVIADVGSEHVAMMLIMNQEARVSRLSLPHGHGVALSRSVLNRGFVLVSLTGWE